MELHRFFIPPGSLRQGAVELGREYAHRLGRVLRLRPDDLVCLFDGSRREFLARIADINPYYVRCIVEEERPCPAEPAVVVTLYQSLIKAQRLEWVLEKGCEMGMSALVPMISTRSVVTGEQSPRRLDRWRRIVIEAAEQCGRCSVPPVLAPIPFIEACQKAQGLLILPWEGEESIHLRDILHSIAQRVPLGEPLAVSLFIGPEGGFTPGEVALVRQRGGHIVSLGRRILRSETAAIAALAVIMAELEGRELLGF